MHLATVDRLTFLRRTVGVVALIMAVAVVAVWAANLSMAGPAQATVDTAGIYYSLVTLGWVEIVAGATVLAGMGAGWWLHRPLWAPGVLAVVLGMTLHWGWWLLDRNVDFFGTTGFNDPDPELVRRATVRMWVMLGFDTVAVLLLLLGGILLLRRARPEPSGTQVAHEPELDGAAAG